MIDVLALPPLLPHGQKAVNSSSTQDVRGSCEEQEAVPCLCSMSLLLPSRVITFLILGGLRLP